MYFLSQSNNKLNAYKQDSTFNDSVSENSSGYDYSKTYESNSSNNAPMFDLEYSDDNEDSDDIELNNNIKSLSMRRKIDASNESRPKLDAKLSDIKLQPIKKKFNK